MDQYSSFLQAVQNLPSKKITWVISSLIFLTFACRFAIGDPQARSKPSATRPKQSNEQTAKIIGPFLSREDSDEYTKVVLKNGLTAIIFERQDIPLAALTVYVKTGMQNESPSQKGASDRVMRGVYFGGKHLPARQAIQEISQLGGLVEANCTAEYTEYTTIIPSNSLQKGIELEADAIRFPDFSEEMLPEENALSLLKNNQILDSPKSYGMERLNQLMLPLTLGQESGFAGERHSSSLGSGELQSFYRRWYTAGNIILVICGNVDRRQALDEVVRNYGDMASARKDPINLQAESPQTIIRYSQLRSEIKQALVFVGFQGPRPYTSEWYACKLLQAILAEGNSSKLIYELTREQGLASSVDYQSLELRQQGGFDFSIATSVQNIEAVEASVFIELERMKNGQLEDSDIERAKNLAERRFYLEQEDISEQSRQLARFEDIARFSEWKTFVAKIRSVTRNEIVQAARQFFLLTRANVVESLPIGYPLREITQPGLQNTLELAVHAKVRDSQIALLPEEKKAKLPKTPSKDTGLSYRKSSGELTSAWVNHELTTYTVLHGPDVLVKESQALPIISLGIFFSGGRTFENANNYGITELMLRASTLKTVRLGPFQIVTGVESYGAVLKTLVGRDFFGYVLTGTKPDFEKTLDALASIINEPRFDEVQIENEKRQLYSEMAAVEDNMDRLARQLFYESIFEQRPYGKPPLGTVESLKKIKSVDVTEWHNLWVRPARPIIVIAGDTDGSEIVSLLSAKLGLAGKSAIELPKPPVIKPPEPNKENILLQKRLHSALVFGVLTPPVSPQVLHPMMATVELLSGPGSCLEQGIRKTHILPAVMSASYEPGWLGSSFAIDVSTLPDVQKKILEVINTQIRLLQDTPIPDDEYKRAVALALTRETKRWQHRDAQVIDYARLKNFGLGVGELREFLTHFRELGRGDIQEAVKSLGPACQVIAGIEGEP